MMEYSDRSWLSGLLIDRPGFDLDQVLAGGIWKEVILGCVPCPGLDQSFGIEGMNAFCFYGPAGTGKHTTALAFAGSIPEQTYIENRCRTFLVHGRDLDDGEGAAARRRVRDLFEEVKKTASVLILDRLGSDLLWEAVEEECLRARDARNLTVFVIEDDPAMIRPEYQRAMLLCRFDLPSYEERLAFFRLPENGMPRRNGLPRESTLAERTDGLNYNQLRNLVRTVRLHVKAQAVSSYGQDPERIFQEYRNGNVYYTETGFVKFRDMLTLNLSGMDGSGEDAGRLRVYLENPPVLAGAAVPAGIQAVAPQAEAKQDSTPLLTDAAIEKDLFAELDLIAQGSE